MEDQKNLKNTQFPLETRKHTKVTLFLILLLGLIVIVVVGYSIYSWKQNENLQTSVNSKTAEIEDLSNEVGALKTVKPSENVILIRELGVSLTVPNSIKDLTYSYKAESDGSEAVGFSTKALTDEYESTGGCTSSFSGAPALGILVRVEGQYTDSDHEGTELVKQFPDYYIEFAGPQDECDINQGSDVLNDLHALENSLSMLKEV